MLLFALLRERTLKYVGGAASVITELEQRQLRSTIRLPRGFQVQGGLPDTYAPNIPWKQDPTRRVCH